MPETALSGAEFKQQMREGKPKMGLFLNSHSPTVAEQPLHQGRAARGRHRFSTSFTVAVMILPQRAGVEIPSKPLLMALDRCARFARRRQRE